MTLINGNVIYYMLSSLAAAVVLLIVSVLAKGVFDYWGAWRRR